MFVATVSPLRSNRLNEFRKMRYVYWEVYIERTADIWRFHDWEFPPQAIAMVFVPFVD